MKTGTTSTSTSTSTSILSPSVRLLALAPHRLMFFIGACNLLLAMAWWTAWLVGARWPARADGKPG